MQTNPSAEQTCPYCGAQVPNQAAFCPYCAQSIRARTQLPTPGVRWRKWLRRLRLTLLLLLPLLILAGTAALYSRTVYPKTYDGQGEVIYTDQDGTYQLTLAYANNRYQPVGTVYQEAAQNEPYRFPSQLYVNHKESGANAGQLFLQKVDTVSAEFLPFNQAGSVANCTQPSPDPDYIPDAALISFVDFSADDDFTAQMVWTLQMKNGDIIQLRQDLVVSMIPTYDYLPNQVPDTSEGLQALVDEISATAESNAVVNLYLPAVTYDGPLVIQDRPFNLYGTAKGGQRTVFTAPIRIEEEANGQISYLEGIDFRGDGTGFALSTAARARAVDCTFTGWKTGFYGYGTAWVNAIGCTFTDNAIGFHFNSTGSSASHSMYNDNLFRNNDTAVLLENVPTDLPLNFANSVFSGNSMDIDNRCSHSLDISQTVFQ